MSLDYECMTFFKVTNTQVDISRQQLKVSLKLAALALAVASVQVPLDRFGHDVDGEHTGLFRGFARSVQRLLLFLLAGVAWVTRTNTKRQWDEHKSEHLRFFALLGTLNCVLSIASGAVAPDNFVIEETGDGHVSIAYKLLHALDVFVRASAVTFFLDSFCNYGLSWTFKDTNMMMAVAIATYSYIVITQWLLPFGVDLEVLIPALIMFWFVVLIMHRNQKFYCDAAYMYQTANVFLSIPRGVSAQLLYLLDLAGDSDEAKLVILISYGVFMTFLDNVLYQTLKGAVPRSESFKFRYLVQAFDDFFGEFILASSKPFSGIFFVMLAWTVGRILLRDGGVLSDLEARCFRRETPIDRATRLRKFFILASQNSLSELTAVIIVPLVIGLDVVYRQFGGSDTVSAGLSGDQVLSIVAAYVVVFAVHALTMHTVHVIWEYRRQRINDVLGTSVPVEAWQQDEDIEPYDPDNVGTKHRLYAEDLDTDEEQQAAASAAAGPSSSAAAASTSATATATAAAAADPPDPEAKENPHARRHMAVGGDQHLQGQLLETSDFFGQAVVHYRKSATVFYIITAFATVSAVTETARLNSRLAFEARD